MRAFGLTEGSGNTHPGQGTANRRFFFANAFLELLWIADEEEVSSPVTAPTMLRERLSGGDAAPFGICFRPSATAPDAAFSTFDYQPSYLPPGMAIQIASDAPLSEPMWFFLATASAPAHWEGARRQPLDHAAGLRHITAVRCTRPAPAMLSQAAKASGIDFVDGDGHLLEISFDNQAGGQIKDFRPLLPVVFRY